MSEAEEVKAQGYIKLHTYDKGAPVLLNAAHIILIHGSERLSTDKSLKTRPVSEIKSLGQAPFVSRETVDEISAIIQASGVDVYGKAS